VHEIRRKRLSKKINKKETHTRVSNWNHRNEITYIHIFLYTHAHLYRYSTGFSSWRAPASLFIFTRSVNYYLVDSSTLYYVTFSNPNTISKKFSIYNKLFTVVFRLLVWRLDFFFFATDELRVPRLARTTVTIDTHIYRDLPAKNTHKITNAHIRLGVDGSRV